MEILRATAEHFGLTEFDLICPRRTGDLILPRQIGMYLAKTLTLRSMPEIGRRFGGRDHTTVMYSVRKIARLAQTDSEIAADISEIKSWFLMEPS